MAARAMVNYLLTIDLLAADDDAKACFNYKKDGAAERSRLESECHVSFFLPTHLSLLLCLFLPPFY